MIRNTAEITFVAGTTQICCATAAAAVELFVALEVWNFWC